MKYKTILFDWDGCLADTLSVWLDAYKKTFADYGLNPSDEVLVKQAIGNWDAARIFDIEDEVAYSEKITTNFANLLGNLKLNGDIKSVFEKLKNGGVSVGIVTSSTRSLVLPFLDQYKISPLVDVLITSDDVKNYKPDPEPIIAALEKMKSIKNTSLMVGDNDKDIEASKRAGVASALFYPEKNQKYYDEETVKAWRPENIFRSWNEFWDIVE